MSKNRQTTDLNSLAKKFPVQVRDKPNMFTVSFVGPEGTPYEKGVWEVLVDMPSVYPQRAPDLIFLNSIFHPNISNSGLVCMDVTDQAWEKKFTLLDIFETFLPTLLHCPNPFDPMNNEAAQHMIYDKVGYIREVELRVQLYAKKKTNENLSANGESHEDKDEVEPKNDDDADMAEAES